MKYKLYSVQDVLVGFAQPFIMQNDMLAERAYKDFLSDPKTSHPEDKRLFYIGEFDDETGKIEGVEPKCLQAGGEKNGGDEVQNDIYKSSG